MKIKINFDTFHHSQNECLRSTKQLTTNAEGMWGVGNPHSLLVGLQTGPATLEIPVANSQNAKNKSSI